MQQHLPYIPSFEGIDESKVLPLLFRKRKKFICERYNIYLNRVKRQQLFGIFFNTRKSDTFDCLVNFLPLPVSGSETYTFIPPLFVAEIFLRFQNPLHSGFALVELCDDEIMQYIHPYRYGDLCCFSCHSFNTCVYSTRRRANSMYLPRFVKDCLKACHSMRCVRYWNG